jgi:pimeloyl-ACP methyl ester carboxylesterase
MATFKTKDGTTLAYTEHGRGPATVIWIHGWSLSSKVWAPVFEHLDHRGIRSVTYDCRGSGASDKPASGYTLERHARDTVELADHLGVKTFALIGHSMGGQIAQWVAAELPERVTHLLLINSVPASGVPLPEQVTALFRPSGGNAQSLANIFSMACKSISASEADRLTKAALESAPNAVAEGFDAWSKASFEPKLSAVRAKTIVLTTDDPFLPRTLLEEKVAARLGPARVAYLPGAGHYPQNERPLETAAVINAFLSGVA